MEDIKAKEKLVIDVFNKWEHRMGDIPFHDNLKATYDCMDEWGKQILKWLLDGKQDLSIAEMSDTEIEEYYDEIIQDINSKQKP